MIFHFLDNIGIHADSVPYSSEWNSARVLSLKGEILRGISLVATLDLSARR